MFSFNISKHNLKSYDESREISNNIIINFNHRELFSEVNNDHIKIYCYGYCFDVREPHNNIHVTFETIDNHESLEELIPYLNGQYIIILQENGTAFLYTDTSSLATIYIKDDSISTDRVSDLAFNPNYKINLDSHDQFRWYDYKKSEHFETDDLLKKFESLLINQYNYFSDKNLILKFKKDNFFKSLVAVLSPVLYNNVLLHNYESATVQEQYFIDYFLKENRMITDSDSYKFENDFKYYCKSNLNNSNVIFKQNKILTDDTNTYSQTTLIEENMMKISSTSNASIKDEFLIFEPMNVRVLINLVLTLSSDKKFSPNNQIVNLLSPSLNYYNFSRDKTLKDISTEQAEKIKTMISNSMASNNEKFLLDTKTYHYKVSRNLAGSVNQNRLITYPVSQSIKKGIEHTIDVSMSSYNFLFIKSFFNNEKNSSRIIVNINDDEYTIDELYDGIYYNTSADIKISLKYKKDYNSLSWQKAGTLLITRS